MIWSHGLGQTQKWSLRQKLPKKFACPTMHVELNQHICNQIQYLQKYTNALSKIDFLLLKNLLDQLIMSRKYLEQLLDGIVGMECSFAFLLTVLSTIGMTGLTVFSMLSSICRYYYWCLNISYLSTCWEFLLNSRVSMLIENRPGTSWSIKKIRIFLVAGTIWVSLEVFIFTRVSFLRV